MRIISPQRNGETMKFLKFTLLAALTLLVAGSALADDPQIVFDPVQATQFNGAYLIQQLGVQYSVSWSSCAAAQVFDPGAFANSTSCVYFINETGVSIPELIFTFGVDSVSAGVFGCTSADDFLSQNNCPTMGSPGTVTTEFFGGSPIPFTPFPSPTVFIVGESGVADPNTDLPITAQAPTHDPNTLILLASGIGLLGLSALRRTA